MKTTSNTRSTATKMDPMPRLSVLMPVYNEARTLRTIVSKVLSVKIDAEIEVVAVDDGSADESGAILEELARSDPRIRVIRHPRNRGKSAAIRTAISHMSGDIAIVQDADLEYDPEDYEKVIAPIVDGRADAVYGSRFAASPERRVLLFWHSLGNKMLTALSNMVNDLNLTDMETCYKAVRADLLRSLRLTSERFGFEPEITARLAQAGARIYEVPISYHGRTYAEGKTINWRDGLEALWLVLKFRFLDTNFSRRGDTTSRQNLGAAKAYRRWLLEQFHGVIGSRVLEVYPGPGHMTAHLLDAPRLVAVDPDPVAVSTLRRRYGHMENVRFELGRPDAAGLHEDTGTDFDTVVCFDGLQRVQHPEALLSALLEVTAIGGSLLVNTPNDAALLSPLDEEIGHVRRFDRVELEDLLVASGWKVVEVRQFNRLGALGWRAQRLLRMNRISRSVSFGFNAAVPVARILERLLPGPGLSLIAIAFRPDPAG